MYQRAMFSVADSLGLFDLVFPLAAKKGYQIEVYELKQLF